MKWRQMNPEFILANFISRIQELNNPINTNYFSPVSKSSVNHQMKLRFINEIEVGFIAAMNQTAIELKTTAFH